jgi:hypothetical protein
LKNVGTDEGSELEGNAICKRVKDGDFEKKERKSSVLYLFHPSSALDHHLLF